MGFDKDTITAPNSTFAIGGVSCSADSFVVKESAVLRVNFCAENPTNEKPETVTCNSI